MRLKISPLLCRLGLVLWLLSVQFYLLALTLLVRQVSPSADVVYKILVAYAQRCLIRCLVVYIINLLHFTQGCVYNIGVSSYCRLFSKN